MYLRHHPSEIPDKVCIHQCVNFSNSRV